MVPQPNKSIKLSSTSIAAATLGKNRQGIGDNQAEHHRVKSAISKTQDAPASITLIFIMHYIEITLGLNGKTKRRKLVRPPKEPWQRTTLDYGSKHNEAFAIVIPPTEITVGFF